MLRVQADHRHHRQGFQEPAQLTDVLGRGVAGIHDHRRRMRRDNLGQRVFPLCIYDDLRLSIQLLSETGDNAFGEQSLTG